eukprot:Skav213604  [mRNA]  locus=scaffold1971:63193:69355:+ [translate_table: standard]
MPRVASEILGLMTNGGHELFDIHNDRLMLDWKVLLQDGSTPVRHCFDQRYNPWRNNSVGSQSNAAWHQLGPGERLEGGDATRGLQHGQDQNYEEVDPIRLKAKENGVILWSGAIDVREDRTKQGLRSGSTELAKAPHEWTSKDQLLVNNYFPVKKNWEDRKFKEKEDRKNNGEPEIADVQWPTNEVLYTDRERLDDAAWNEVLENEWVKDHLNFLKDPHRGKRSGFANFCIPVVCDEERVKARKGRW